MYLKLQAISTKLSEMILKRKEDYYCMLSDKLNDPHTSAKSYWSILKTLYNGKKIPLIPLILTNKLISKFKEKANYFNAFFASHCTPIPDDSMLPFVITPATNASLSSISFRDQDVLKITHSLSINKAHSYDDISVRLLKICDSSIVRPLSIIFKNCLQSLPGEGYTCTPMCQHMPKSIYAYKTLYVQISIINIAWHAQKLSSQ